MVVASRPHPPPCRFLANWYGTQKGRRLRIHILASYIRWPSDKGSGALLMIASHPASWRVRRQRTGQFGFTSLRASQQTRETNAQKKKMSARPHQRSGSVTAGALRIPSGRERNEKHPGKVDAARLVHAANDLATGTRHGRAAATRNAEPR